MVISQEVLSRAEEIADQVSFAARLRPPSRATRDPIPRGLCARGSGRGVRILRESEPRGGPLLATSLSLVARIFPYFRTRVSLLVFANRTAATKAAVFRGYECHR